MHITHHDTLRQIRFRKDYGAESLQGIDEERIRAGRVERTTNVAQGRIESLYVELIFK